MEQMKYIIWNWIDLTRIPARYQLTRSGKNPDIYVPGFDDNPSKLVFNPIFSVCYPINLIRYAFDPILVWPDINPNLL